LVVAGGLAFWYFNKGESEEKSVEPVLSQIEETSHAEVNLIKIISGQKKKTEKKQKEEKRNQRRRSNQQ
jgi:hypothetical protein